MNEHGVGMHLHHDDRYGDDLRVEPQAWTAPRTWVTSELVTSAIMNTHVRDNLLALRSHIGARAYHNANQSITSATLTVLALNSERYDTDTIHDTATNNSRLTCKTAGVYAISGNVSFAANATGLRELDILLNGATMIASKTVGNVGGTVATIVDVGCDYLLAVNDYVELRVYQDSGGALNVLSTGNYTPEFSMHFTGT